ncbi:MAG: hypothetical protein KDB10_00780 [Acidimicrobiales bacterium]|nr:hypothetical protein [Acidimicrobiales bacterium]
MREQRGATLTEYALMVALVAIVCLGALAVLGRRSADTVDEAAAKIDADHGSTVPGGGGGGGGGGGVARGGSGGGGGGGGGDGATTTTAPVPTTAPPTTTTTPPTTAAPSTTTTAPQPGDEFPEDSGFIDGEQVWSGSEWRLHTALVLRAPNGAPLADTDATVQQWRHVRTSYGWTWIRTLVPVTTGPDGTVTFVTDPAFPAWGNGAADRIVLSIVAVDHSAWDQSSGTLDFEP